MGRKSKTTPEQDQRLIERHLAGESIRSLAKEVGISEASLRAKISAQSSQIKTAAQHIVAAERSLTKMTISAQITARTIASKMLRTMDLVATGNELMGGSYMKLAMAHNAQAAKVDENDPMTAKGSAEALVAMSALGKLANQAAEIPMRMLMAMKDGISGDEDEDDGGPVIRVVGGLPD